MRKIRGNSTPFQESSISLNTKIQQIDIEDCISSGRVVVYTHGNVEVYVHKIYPNTLYVRRKSKYPAISFSMQCEWLIFKLNKGAYVVGAIPG